MKTAVLSFTILFILCCSVLGDIYKYIDDDGVEHYTNTPPTVNAEIFIDASDFEKSREELEKEYGPKPGSSGWDGSVRCVKRYLEKVLKDPDSVTYEAWGPVQYDDRGWVVKCQYRARNSFGGYVKEMKSFTIRNGQVVDAK